MMTATTKVEMLRAEFATARQNHGAFDDVLEFTHVARPRIIFELGDGIERCRQRRHAHVARVLGDEVVGEMHDIAGAIAQRR